MNTDTDQYRDVLQNIESSLVQIYGHNEAVSDSMIMTALGKGKIAIKQTFGYAKSQNASPSNNSENSVIQAIVAIGEMRIGKINGLTLDLYVNLIDKIARSVDTHRQHGVRGYYEFIKNYVQ